MSRGVTWEEPPGSCRGVSCDRSREVSWPFGSFQKQDEPLFKEVAEENLCQSPEDPEELPTYPPPPVVALFCSRSLSPRKGTVIELELMYFTAQALVTELVLLALNS